MFSVFWGLRTFDRWEARLVPHYRSCKVQILSAPPCLVVCVPQLGSDNQSSESGLRIGNKQRKVAGAVEHSLWYLQQCQQLTPRAVGRLPPGPVWVGRGHLVRWFSDVVLAIHLCLLMNLGSQMSWQLCDLFSELLGSSARACSVAFSQDPY